MRAWIWLVASLTLTQFCAVSSSCAALPQRLPAKTCKSRSEKERSFYSSRALFSSEPDTWAERKKSKRGIRFPTCFLTEKDDRRDAAAAAAAAESSESCFVWSRRSSVETPRTDDDEAQGEREREGEEKEGGRREKTAGKTCNRQERERDRQKRRTAFPSGTSNSSSL